MAKTKEPGKYKKQLSDLEIDLALDTVVDDSVEELENLSTPVERAKAELEVVPWSEYNFTERQRAFIEYYCADPTNATRAALNAGYAPSVAAKEGYLALKNPTVSAIIAKVMNARIERTALTQDKILHELEVLMTATLDDYEHSGGTIRVKEGRPEYLIKAVKNVEYTKEVSLDASGNPVETYRTKVYLYNKEAIIRMAGQYHQMFVERIEKSGKVDHTHTHKWKVGDKEISF